MKSSKDTFALIQQGLAPLVFLRIPLDAGGEKLLLLQSIGMVDKEKDGTLRIALLSGQTFTLSANECASFDKAITEAIDEAIKRQAQQNMSAMLQAGGGVLRH